jgi:hypothetical protein
MIISTTSVPSRSTALNQSMVSRWASPPPWNAPAVTSGAAEFTGGVEDEVDDVVVSATVMTELRPRRLGARRRPVQP